MTGVQMLVFITQTSASTGFRTRDLSSRRHHETRRTNLSATEVKILPEAPPVISGGLWTDDDLAELVRLVKKYPGGTSERWERIAETMCRSVPEVTHMAHKLKDNCYKIPGQEEEHQVVEPPKKVKTRKAEEVSGANSGGNWSQSQQRALEAALLKHPKGVAYDRWASIAAAVTGKTKAPPVISGGLWTDDDLAELVRLVKKYPGGTSERWERIAETMCRSVPEVTHMAHKLKDNCYKIPGQEEEPQVVEPPKKVKTRKAEEVSGPNSGGNWSQSQQRALEAALLKHPKGVAYDRWASIAAAVTGKTKEECMQRCKYLSDMVRKQKQKEEEQQKEDDTERSEDCSEQNGDVSS
ncbi:hypothetical protein evm_001901 [Chilo suppressalis]|nr:hypothetical protein evm_001901 [Chilo suppressalis]